MGIRRKSGPFLLRHDDFSAHVCDEVACPTPAITPRYNTPIFTYVSLHPDIGPRYRSVQSNANFFRKFIHALENSRISPRSPDTSAFSFFRSCHSIRCMTRLAVVARARSHRMLRISPLSCVFKHFCAVKTDLGVDRGLVFHNISTYPDSFSHFARPNIVRFMEFARSLRSYLQRTYVLRCHELQFAWLPSFPADKNVRSACEASITLLL